jgi:DNA-binding MurR/RpiR family transcriptional regulator
VTVASIEQRIAEAASRLTPQEQRAADFILDHLADLAVYNATELARMSGVSKATVSRLFRTLGFADAQEVRDHVRELRGSGAPLGSAASAPLGETLAAVAEQEARNLRTALASLAPRLQPLAALLASAERVLVIGQRNGYPVALHLREQLAQSRQRVGLAPQPGQTVGEELAGLGAEDAVVIVGFRRRTAGFERMLDAANASGASTVLIADPSARRYAQRADHWIECPNDSPGAFDSYAAAETVVSVLAAAVLAELQRDGRRRVAEIGALYASLGELEG